MTATPKPLTEHVLVFPSALLDELGRFHGLCFDVERYLPTVLDPANHRFMRRSDVEDDPTYKQLIPYAILRHRERFFCYRRGKLMDEPRLHQCYSIGVGGHISTEDPNLFGGQTFAIRGNFGTFEGENDLGFTAMGVVARNAFGGNAIVAVGAGVGLGLDESTAGGRVGVQVGW